MTQQRLHEDIGRLRREVETLAPDDAARQRIGTLLDEIEVEATSTAPRPQGSAFTAPIRAAIDQFEVSHPRATAILNDLMVTLGNLGI